MEKPSMRSRPIAPRRIRTLSSHRALEQLEPRQLLTAAISSALAIGNATDNANDRITSMVVDTDGTLYVLGTFKGTMDIDPSFVNKPVTNVTTVYSTGPLIDPISGLPIVDPITGLPITTTFTNTFADSVDLFIAAYKNNTLQWFSTVGSAADDTAGNLAIYQNHLVITGTFTGALYMDANAYALNALNTTSLNLETPVLAYGNGGSDGFILHYSKTGRYLGTTQDVTGNKNATQVLGSAGNDSAPFVVPAADGSGLFAMGAFSAPIDLDVTATTTLLTPTGSNPNIYIAKLNNDGTVAWANQYADTTTLKIADLTVDPASGDLFLAGTFNGAVDLDGSSGTYNVASAADTAFILKLSAADGKLRTITANNATSPWVKTFGPATGAGASLDIADLAIDSAGNLVLAGNFKGTLDVDPSAAAVNLTSPVSTGFLLRLDSKGEYTAATAYTGNETGTSVSTVSAIAFDANNNLYVAGTFHKTVDFDFRAGTANFTAPSAFDTPFVAKYDAAWNFLWQRQASGATDNAQVELLTLAPANKLIVAGKYSKRLTFSVAQGGFLGNADTSLQSDLSGANFLLTVDLSRETPTVALTKSLSNPIAGQNVTFYATVNSATGLPSGTVNFYDNNVLLATVPVGADKVAAYTWLSTPGSHSIVAQYSGDNNFNGASSAVTPVVPSANQAPAGSLDSTARGMFSGWTADLDDTSAKLITQVLVDGQLRGSVVADDTRDDLQAAIGSTAHGFSVVIPYLMTGTHIVQVVAYDSLSSQGHVVATRTVTSFSPYFNEAWYLATYPDVAAAVANGSLVSGWQHFSSVGSREGRNPSPFFDEAWYLAHNSDVAASVSAGTLPSGFTQFAATGAREGRDPSPLFNTAYYLRANPDVAAAVATGGITAFAHFLTTGQYEGRTGIPWFNPQYYAANNPAVVAAVNKGTVGSLFEHFVTTGIAENRAPSALFSESAYLANNPDVAAAVNANTPGGIKSGLEHFVRTGFNEGRISVASFDSAAYLAANPAAAAAVANGTVASAFQYSLLYGPLPSQNV
jgi:hypothetical protein